MIAIRSEREISLLRDANRIVAEVHALLAKALKPGITTRELDEKAEAYIRKQGGTPAFKGYRGFPAATCISIDREIVHGIPGGRALRNGQIVSIDVGVCYRGYYGDAAVTWPCGTIDDEKRQLLLTTDYALAQGIAAARAGNHLHDIGRAIEAPCLSAGYGVVRDFVGHGIGTSMHEKPEVPNFDTGNKGPVLKEGMVLAIEPMVNLGTHQVRVLEDGWTAVTADGKASAHFEHSVVVRKDGGEVLSSSEVCVWGYGTGPKLNAAPA